MSVRRCVLLFSLLLLSGLVFRVSAKSPKYGVVILGGFEMFFGYHEIRVDSLDAFSAFCVDVLSDTEYKPDNTFQFPPQTEADLLNMTCAIEALLPVFDPATNETHYRSDVSVRLNTALIENSLAPLLSFLEQEFGYVLGESLIVHERDDVFPCTDPAIMAQFQLDVEAAAMAAESRKTVVIGICGGALCANLMFELLPPAWKSEYVQRFVSLIAPVGGATATPMQLLQVRNAMAGPYEGYFSLLDEMFSIISMSLVNPNSYSPVGMYTIDDGRTFGSQSYCDFFRTILRLPRLSDYCEELYSRRKGLWSPGVPVTAVWTMLTAPPPTPGGAGGNDIPTITPSAPFWISDNLTSILPTEVVGDQWVGCGEPFALVSQWIRVEGLDGDVAVLRGAGPEYQHGYGVLENKDILGRIKTVLSS